MRLLRSHFFDAPNDSHLCLSFICTTTVRMLTAPGRPGFTISGVGTQVRKVQFGDLADTCPTTHDKTIGLGRGVHLVVGKCR